MYDGVLNRISCKILFLDLVEEGGKAVLSCSYTLGESEFVDSVKWFLNRTEIYRIVPGLIDYR